MTAPSPAALRPSLTAAERAVVLGLARGLRQADIARAWGVVHGDIGNRVARARRKLGLAPWAEPAEIVAAYRAFLDEERAALEGAASASHTQA